MDQKTVAENPKRANKESMNKKKAQPLKVVYITNPIKFTATASEFRALVQELTGQDADVSEHSRLAADKDGLVHAAGGQQGGGGAAEKGSDLSTSGGSTYEDDRFFCSPDEMMIDNLQGMEASGLMWHHDEDVHLDVFKRLGPM